MTTDIAAVDYLADLPWFAVVAPDEPTPLFDALTAEIAAATPCWCGSVGDPGEVPCVTPTGRRTKPHAGRGGAS